MATSRAVLDDFGFADLEQLRRRFRLRAGAGAARITNRDRAGVVVRHRPKHVDEFVFILRLHVDDVRHVPQIADVEQAMVRRAVVAAQSGAVHAKRDVQVLQRDVMNDHVVGALHEGRIDREERLQSLRREAAGKQRRVFLRDADVEIAVGMLRLEKAEPGAARHRRR